MNAIALFSDTQMLPGLHVTLLSLLRSFGGNQAEGICIFLFLDAVSEREKAQLEATYTPYRDICALKIVDYSPKALEGTKTLHGNETTYGRLYLPTLLPDYEQCIYLDSDLVVNRNVIEMFDHFDGQHVLFGDGVGQWQYSLDAELCVKAGFDLQDPYFNAGVLGIDLRLWREREIEQVCLKTVEQYSHLFQCSDQSLLNTALHGSFLPVGNAINTIVYPHTPKLTEMEERIYHFVGSPKPWDFLGNIATINYNLWKELYRETAIGNRWHLRYTTLQRTRSISKSTVKHLLKKARLLK